MKNMFYGCNQLVAITLGENFSFRGNNLDTSYQVLLPTITTTPYTGVWTNRTQTLSATELRDTYDGSTMAGEWHVEMAADYNMSIKATGIQATSFKDYKEAFAVLNGNYSRYLFDTALAEMNIGLKY